MRVRIDNVEYEVSAEKGEKLIRTRNAREIQIPEVKTGPAGMKVPELRALASEHGIDNAESMKKDELLEALEGVV